MNSSWALEYQRKSIHFTYLTYLYIIIDIKWFIYEVFSLKCPIYRQNISSFLDSASRARFIGTPCICAGLAPCIWTSKPLSFLHLPLLDMSDPIWHSISYPIPIVGNQDTFMRECRYRITITVCPSTRPPHTPSSFLPCTLVKGTLLVLKAVEKFKLVIQLYLSKCILFQPNSRQSRHIHVGMRV